MNLIANNNNYFKFIWLKKNNKEARTTIQKINEIFKIWEKIRNISNNF